MSNITKQDILNYIKQSTTIELNELVTLIKETFDVQDMVMSTNASSSATQEEAKTSFNVILKTQGSNKIAAIKAVRKALDLDLVAAKDKVNSIPFTLAENVSKEQAESLKQEFASTDMEISIE